MSAVKDYVQLYEGEHVRTPLSFLSTLLVLHRALLFYGLDAFAIQRIRGAVQSRIAPGVAIGRDWRFNSRLEFHLITVVSVFGVGAGAGR